MKINLRKICVSIGIILVNINIYIFIAGNMLIKYLTGNTDSFFYEGEYLLLITSSFVVATIILHLALLGRRSLNKKVYIALAISLIYFVIYAFNSSSGLLNLPDEAGLIIAAYTVVVAIAYKIIASYFKSETI